MQKRFAKLVTEAVLTLMLTAACGQADSDTTATDTPTAQQSPVLTVPTSTPTSEQAPAFGTSGIVFTSCPDEAGVTRVNNYAEGVEQPPIDFHTTPTSAAASRATCALGTGGPNRHNSPQRGAFTPGYTAMYATEEAVTGGTTVGTIDQQGSYHQLTAAATGDFDADAAAEDPLYHAESGRVVYKDVGKNGAMTFFSMRPNSTDVQPEPAADKYISPEGNGEYGLAVSDKIIPLGEAVNRDGTLEARVTNGFAVIGKPPVTADSKGAFLDKAPFDNCTVAGFSGDRTVICYTDTAIYSLTVAGDKATVVTLFESKSDKEVHDVMLDEPSDGSASTSLVFVAGTSKNDQSIYRLVSLTERSDAVPMVTGDKEDIGTDLILVAYTP